MENGHEPATKRDVIDATTALRDELVEVIRDSQTEVLKAFYSFAESNRQRVAQLEGNQGALITRVGVLEDRMTELERKINFPNHPTQ